MNIANSIVITAIILNAILGMRQLRFLLRYPCQDAQYQKIRQYAIANFLLTQAAWFIMMFAILLLLSTDTLFNLQVYFYQLSPTPLFNQLTFLLFILLCYFLFKTMVNSIKLFGIDRRFQLCTLSLRLHLQDTVKRFFIAFSIAYAFCLTVILTQQITAYWWLFLWGISLIMSALYFKILIVFIGPLFNCYTACPHALSKKLTDLLSQFHFNQNDIVQIDQSQRSTIGNAFVGGMGKFKKIIVFDTLAKQLSHEEMEAVIAHELGHYVANHTLKFYLVFSVLSLFIFWLATHFVGVNNPVLGIATCLLLIPSVTFFLNPLVHTMSRRFESQADLFAATHHEINAIASALIKLHQQNYALPDADRLYMRWYYSHPTLNDRLHALNRAPSSTNPPG